MKKSILSLSTLVILAAVIFTGLNWAQANPPEIIGHQLDDEISPPAQTSKVDLFLYIEGVNGESTDPEHEDWIDVLSYAHGMGDHGPGTAPSVSRRSSGTKHYDFSIAKAIDKATPLLSLYVNNGANTPEVILEICKVTTTTDTPRACYMKYKFVDVRITSVRPGGSSAEGDLRPMEEITFNYEKIRWEYTEIGDNGLPAGTIERGWDVVTDEEF